MIQEFGNFRHNTGETGASARYMQLAACWAKPRGKKGKGKGKKKGQKRRKDVPSNKQLIASQNSTEEIRRRIGADSLGYMQISELQDMVGDLPICKACFDSNYPMEVPDHEIRDAFEGS